MVTIAIVIYKEEDRALNRRSAIGQRIDCGIADKGKQGHGLLSR